MSLLETLEQKISGKSPGNLGGNKQGAMLSALTGLIASSGGLSGLISKFSQNGLGQHAESWVGKGENMPITNEHVEQVFGEDQIKQVAQQTGVEPAHASGWIAKLLPQLVDKVTPHGKPVSDSEAHQGFSSILSGGSGALSSLFGAK